METIHTERAWLNICGNPTVNGFYLQSRISIKQSVNNGVNEVEVLIDNHKTFRGIEGNSTVFCTFFHDVSNEVHHVSGKPLIMNVYGVRDNAANAIIIGEIGTVFEVDGQFWIITHNGLEETFNPKDTGYVKLTDFIDQQQSTKA